MPARRPPAPEVIPSSDNYKTQDLSRSPLLSPPPTATASLLPYILLTLFSATMLNANLRSNCYIPLCFALWYALNVAYNITNKWALENVHQFVGESTSHSSALPFTIGCLQFGIGSLYACTIWMLGWRRPVPHAEELSRAATIIANYARKLCWRTMRLARLDQLSPRYYASMTSPNNVPPHTNIEYTPAKTSDENRSPSSINIRQTFHIAVHHTLGQLCTVISLSASSISFTHVIKAMEPLFSALASRLVLGQKMDIRVHLSLLPVVGGVIMACAGSRDFSWISFCAGMCSNALFAMRGVVSKMAMEGSSKQRVSVLKSNSSDDETMDNEESNGAIDDVEHNSSNEKERPNAPPTMSPSNLFAAVTCVSFFLSIPLALIFEGEILREIAHISAKDGVERENQNDNHQTILIYIATSGLFHYLNNEVMYLVLSNVHPITLAVGNTLKRVFIIIAGVLVFATPVTLQSAIGCVIGIGGVLLYSMMKQWYGSGSVPGSNASICSVKLR